MLKRIFKRIFVLSSVFCLLSACVPSLSFAVDPVSGAMALAGAIDAYGMAYGVGTVYDVSSSSGVTSSFEGLWDEFSLYRSNAGSQFDYDSYIEDYNLNRSLYGFEHSSGKFAAWSIDAESAEIFDQFWDWLLTGPAEMTRVDNEYFQFSQDQIGSEATPLPVISLRVGVFSDQPIPRLNSPSAVYSSGLPIYTYLANQYSYVCHVGTAIASDIYCFAYPSSTNYTFTCVSLSSGSAVYNGPSSSSAQTVNVTSSNSSYGTTVYYSNNFITIPSANSAYIGVPIFSSRNEGIQAFLSYLSSSDSDDVGVKSYSEDGVVSLPNPYGQDYVPTPLEIVTNVPWDSSYDDTDEDGGSPVPYPPSSVPLVVVDIISAISAEDYALEVDPNDPDPDPPPPAPSEVFVPLLPVGLPSFNFSFSGIWHYVREWVSSLGAWLTTLFSIWGALPYAMVVPVYATAVVVIVLGVYKRFFM